MAIIVMLLAAVTVGCANYQVGDLSKSYCESTDPVFRSGVKKLLANQGVVLDVDYCTAHGLVDMMVRSGRTNE